MSAHDRERLSSLLAYINEARGIDLSLYRHATIVRKLDLRVEETRTGSYSSYLDYLKSHPSELDVLINAVAIKVSSFFRNPAVFELLGAFILPEILSDFGFLKAWSMGCAHGEEPYSVAMILRDLMRAGRVFDIKILGTDICDEAISKATAGIYPVEELAEVKKKYLDACFEMVPFRADAHTGQEHHYRIRNDIKAMVQLDCGDMLAQLRLSRARPLRFNLILCRNVLIYMNRSLQSEVVGLISDILHENGYLIIGETETIPVDARGALIQPFPGVKIFKKRSLVKTPFDRMS